MSNCSFHIRSDQGKHWRCTSGNGDWYKPVLLWKWGWSHFLIEKKINVQIVLTKNLCSYKDHHSRKYFYLEYIFVENLSFRINCVWKENICFKLHVNGGKIIILTEAIRFCFMVGEKSYFFQWRKSSTKKCILIFQYWLFILFYWLH